MTKQKPVEVYCDGSAYSKFGGYGIVLIFGDKYKEIKSKPYKDTTIARMEMKAIIRALESIKPGHSIYLYSDCKPLIDNINRRLDNWLMLDIINEKENLDLWKRFLKTRKKHILGHSYIQFSWIRGHSGSKFNEKADTIAKEVLKSKKNRIKCNAGN